MLWPEEHKRTDTHTHTVATEHSTTPHLRAVNKIYCKVFKLAWNTLRNTLAVEYAIHKGDCWECWQQSSGWTRVLPVVKIPKQLSTDLHVGFTAILSIYHFYSAAHWTELKRNSKRVRNWVRFDNACPKFGIYAPLKLMVQKPPIFDVFDDFAAKGQL